MKAMKYGGGLALVLVLLGGCEDDSGGSGSGSDPCKENCSDCAGSTGSAELYGCACDVDLNGIGCEPGEACCTECLASSQDPDAWCANRCNQAHGPGVDYAFDPVGCAHYDPEGTCSGWDPAQWITLDNGAYIVDLSELQALAAEPAPLWTCDGGTIEPLSSGSGFEIKNTNRGEFLYELGLRNDDVPLSVNGQSLDSYADALVAYGLIAFWETTELTLRVDRGGTTVSLEYTLQ